jgi:uncharacterized repeat protein (TIGR03803 family)
MKQLYRLVAAFLNAALLVACGGSSGLFSSTPISVAPQIAAPQSATAGSTSRYLEPSFAPLADSGYKSLYSFKGGTDGANPYAGLLAVNGALYGTTENGGAGRCVSRGCGTVFNLTTSGTEHVLHSFNGRNGYNPVAGLINVNGTLYGTTELGGCGGCGRHGNVFAIGTSGKEQVLYDFRGKETGDGYYPAAGLLNVSGTLYGTTFNGGEEFLGTVFAIRTSGIGYRSLYSFKGRPGGVQPLAGLININGTLYGTTSSGGSCTSSCGTVFKISTSGKERVVYSFKGGIDGLNPAAGLLDVNGTLYGTTAFGGTGCHHKSGAPGCGIVFKVSTSGTEVVLHRFKGGTDGANPYAGLIAVNDSLYGTTENGGSGCSGSGGCGTVFEVSASGKERVLYRFKGGSDGAFPEAGPINVSGTLYGTTAGGGTDGDGTVFRISP